MELTLCSFLVSAVEESVYCSFAFVLEHYVLLCGFSSPRRPCFALASTCFSLHRTHLECSVSSDTHTERWRGQAFSRSTKSCFPTCDSTLVITALQGSSSVQGCPCPFLFCRFAFLPAIKCPCLKSVMLCDGCFREAGEGTDGKKSWMCMAGSTLGLILSDYMK